MIGVQVFDIIQLYAFFLVVTRVSAIVLQFPLFDYLNIPVVVKAVSVLVISYALFGRVGTYAIQDVQNWGTDSIIALTFFHSIVGLMIGFFVKSIISFATASGSIMSQSMGFSAMRYFDPSSGQQVGPIEKLISFSLVLMLLSTGALVPMFKGVILSFENFNTYQASKLLVGHEYYFKFFKDIFKISIMLASPLVFTNLLLYMVLGIVSRLVPQMNVLMVSFVVNIGLGLFVFWAMSQEIFQNAYVRYVDSLGIWFQYLGA